MADGWNCPNCGKAHGPHVDTCPEQAATPLYRFVYYTEPAHYTKPYDPRYPGYGTAPYRPSYPFTTC